MPDYTGTRYDATRTYNIGEQGAIPSLQITNSNGSFTTTQVAGNIPYTLPDISVLEGDGTAVTYPSAVNINTSQRTFTTTLTIKSGSNLTIGRQVVNAGTIKGVALTNVASYTVQRVRAGVVTTVTVPFAVQATDIIQVTVVQTDSAQDSVVAFTGYHDVVTASQTQPASNGDGRYLYVVNYVDQTVSVIDLNSHTVTATITLPAGKNFTTGIYRSNDKTGWFFGDSYYAKVDCNPASGTFNTVLTHGSLSINSNQAGVAYDYVNDIIYTGSSNSVVFKLVPGTLALTNLATSNGISTGINGWMRFLAPIRGVFCGDPTQSQLIISTDDDTPKYGFGQGNLGQLQYSYTNGKLYQCGNGSVIVRSANPVKQLAAISSTNARGSLKLVPSQNKAFVGSPFTNSISVVNTSTDTAIGNVAKTSPASSETGTRQLLYSSFSDRVYAQGMNNAGAVTNVNKVHYFNPSTNAYVGSVTVGNMDGLNGHQWYGSQMFLNQIIP